MSNEKEEVFEIVPEETNQESDAIEVVEVATEDLKEPEEKKANPDPATAKRSATAAKDDNNRLKVGKMVRGNFVLGNDEINATTMTQEQEELQRLANLRKHVKNHDIVYSNITGIIPDADNNTFIVCSTCDGFPVYIRDNDMFDYKNFMRQYEAMSDKEKYEYRLRRARRMGSGACIYFVLGSIHADTKEIYVPELDKTVKKNVYVVTGSRVAASARNRDRYFFDKNSDDYGKVRAATKTTPGTVVEACILDCQRAGILVEAYGVETIIYAPNISAQRWISDCNTERSLQPGKMIRCLVTGLDIDEENKTVKMALSSRAIEINLMRERVSIVKPGTVSFGTVVLYNESKGFYTISLDLGVLGTVAVDRVRGGRILTLGQRVSFIAERVREEQGYVSGSCIPQ